jgi:hypothetical protein
MRHLGEDDVHGLGIGYFGEVAEGPNGGLYQWVEGVDGLGNPMGFWKAVRKLRNLGRKALAVGMKVAPFIPGAGQAAAVLNTASPALKRAGLLGEANAFSGFADDELGGVDADAELDGLSADPELQGFDADELQGFDADELQGFDADELQGFDAADELQGLDAADELDGLGDDALQADGQDLTGYVRTPGVEGIGAYGPERPATTPWASAPTRPATPWKPLW